MAKKYGKSQGILSVRQSGNPGKTNTFLHAVVGLLILYNLERIICGFRSAGKENGWNY